MIVGLFSDLKQGTCSPVNTGCFRSRDSYILRNGNSISFFSQFLIFLQCQIEITGLRFSGLDLKCVSEHFFPVSSKGLRNTLQRSVAINDAGLFRRDERSVLALPFFQFRNNKRFCILSGYAHTSQTQQAKSQDCFFQKV